MNNKELFLHLSLIDDISAITIAAALQQKQTSINAHELYQMSASDLMSLFGLSLKDAHKIETGLADTKTLENELTLIEKYNIQWATLFCDAYPAMLKNIHLPPPVIYWQGENPDAQKSVAIVGSRKANAYGQYVIEQLVPPLVEYGYTIISGGALGADAMAHHATLQAGGKTMAVLGSGLLRAGPPSNKKLFEHIITHGGTMLSTFPLQLEAFPQNFPARNRIISGLSRGTIVVQAAARSGTSITAHFALEQGRDIFAVPGPITDELSAGCHALIAQGAKITTHAYDVLVEFGDPAFATDELRRARVIPEQKIEASKSKNKNISCETQVPLFKPAVVQEPDNSPAGKILHHCKQPISTDELSEKTGFDLATLNALLFDLRLEGKIDQNFMGMWESK